MTEDMMAYISSLEGSGVKYTHDKWCEIIRGENDDFRRQDDRVRVLSNSEIESVIDILDHDGYVIKGGVKK